MRERLAQVTYVTLMAAGALMSFGKVFLLGRFLPKAGFGEYVLLSGIVAYAVPVASFGLLEGLGRSFPVLLGQGRLQEARRLRSQCLGAISLIACAIMLFAIGGALVSDYLAGTSLLLRTLLVSVEVYAFVFFYFALRDLRNNLRSALYGLLMLLKGLLDVGAVFVAAPRFGWAGVLVAETVVVASLTVIALLFVDGPGMSFSGFSTVKAMIRDGILITLSGGLATTARLADRLILGTLLPRELFAVYGFHLLTITGAGVVVNIIYQYVSPRILHLYGQTGSDRAIQDYLWRMAAVLALLVMAGGVVVPFVFGYVSHTFFRGYEVNQVLLLLLYAAGAIDVVNVFTIGIIARGAFWSLIGINALASAVSAGALLVAAQRTDNLIVFGAIVLVARAVWFTATVAVSARRADSPEAMAGGVA